MRQDYLVLKDLTKKFGKGDAAVTAVDAINLTVKEGELITLLGPSGCGKTTTLRMIAGFHTFQISGSHMGGVLGGFNREYSKNNYIYERVIVASLNYAIKNSIKKVHYIIDFSDYFLFIITAHF